MLPSQIRYGAMLEVPALAEQLDLLLPKLDFLSIGTNDLTQFLFAADRANPKLAERYDWLSPSILRFIRRIVGPTRDAGVDLAVCGERSEEHTSELQSLMRISYAVFCLQKKKTSSLKKHTYNTTLEVGT